MTPYSTGIDAAFHVLRKYEGIGRAQEVATFLEYNHKIFPPTIH